MTIEIRPASRRFRTVTEGRETFHAFSFGGHYDPSNTGFGSLVALNDEHLPSGTGYDDHPHRDLEIVTWVLEGVLRHTDSALGTRDLVAGDVLRTSAGSGIVHSEVSAYDGRTRFLQTWLRPDEPGGVPSLASTTAPADGLVDVIGDVGLGTAGARLYLGRATREVVVPDAPRVHLYVVEGTVGVGDRSLGADDAARLVDEGGRRLDVCGGATLALWALG